MPEQEDFKIEAYGTVTPPPEPPELDEPDEGDNEEKDD
jgi:hypothetical protein